MRGIVCHQVIESKDIDLLAPIPPPQPLLLLVEPRLFVGRLVAGKEIVPEGAKGAIKDSVSYLLHQMADKAQVMNGSQS